ncbi:N-6 DNA methylase [Acinetobacter baumannii]
MFEIISKEYLKEFQKLVQQTMEAGSTSTEMATRPIVHNYISKIMELVRPESVELKVYHDTSYTRIHRPDWRIENNKNFGVYFFGDQKNLSLTKPFSLSKNEKEQIKGYLDLGYPVFVFDGIEFLIYKEDINNPSKYQIIKKPLDLKNDWSLNLIDSSILDEFRDLLKNIGFRKWTELALIKKLAHKARYIGLEIEALLEIPKGSGISLEENLLIEDLVQLHNVLKENHDPILESPLACANFVAQVLTFGLFYAHTRQIVDTSDPEQRKKAIERFWEKGLIEKSEFLLRPFKTILDYCEESLNRVNILSEWYKEVLNILAHAEYMGTEPQPLDFHTLFEEFFKAFDPKQRFDKGAFYTPIDLGDWIVNAAESYILSEYKKELRSMVDKVIDPCCGTGSLLESVIKAISTGTDEKKVKFIGFEILPAPYALANYRLRNLNKISDNSEIKLFLTDTLSDALINLANIHGENGFIDELIEVRKSTQPPIQLIIANPPSANPIEYKGNRLNISSLMDDFRPPKEERTDRQNVQKALDNDAYRFLRWCAEISLQSERSMMALVMPGALAYSPSFKYLRKWLLEHFHDLLVLQIDSDARTNAVTQSLFNVKQGRLILIAMRDSERLYKINNEIMFHDISDQTRIKKINFLKNFSLNEFKKLMCEEPNYLFLENDYYPKDLWDSCVSLKETKKHKIGIFKEKCSGLKLAPTALLFHTDQNILKRRSLEISGKGAGRDKDNKELVDMWFKGQQKLPNTEKLTADVKKNIITTSISKYSFRPFLTGYLLNSLSLFNALSKTAGGGTRSRPEIRFAFENEALGISLAPSPIDLGNELTRFSSFVWYIPDNDLVARGNAMIYCNKFPVKDKINDKYILVENIGVEVKEYFKNSQQILFYIYAVLSSNIYLKTFNGILFKAADPENPPRIPILKDECVRYKIIELGEKIAKCEDIDFIEQISSYENLSIVIDKIETGFQLGKFSINNNELELRDNIGVRLSIKVKNPLILKLCISGHNVVEKWLREKTYNYYRRNFDNNNLVELKQLLKSIDLQLDLLNQVDELLSNNFSVTDFIKF